VSIRKFFLAGLLAAAAMATSTASMAQFDGFYIGGGFTRFKASETADDFPFVGVRGTAGTEEHQGGFNGFVGYGLTIVGPLHLALEASFSNQIGEVLFKTPFGDVTDSLEEAAAVSILPGLKLGPSALIYARIGAAQAKLKTSVSDFNQTQKGTLFGVGMKGAVAKNLCLVVEYQNYDFKEKDGVKPEAVGLLLGAQFTF
jgi:opacity protein-like surface antigen